MNPDYDRKPSICDDEGCSAYGQPIPHLGVCTGSGSRRYTDEAPMDTMRAWDALARELTAVSNEIERVIKDIEAVEARGEALRDRVKLLTEQQAGIEFALNRLEAP